MQWGVFDTKKNLWFGNDSGPASFEDEMVARVTAEMLDVMLGQERCKHRPLPSHASWKFREYLPTRMSMLEALQGKEDGYDETIDPGWA